MLCGDDDPRNARWTDRNRALALALTIYEAGLCKGCGHPTHETADEGAPTEYSAEDFLCRGCAVLQQAPSENDKPGVKWYVSALRG